MTRTELIEQIYIRFQNLKLQDVDQCVRLILDSITKSLARGERAEIRGFGTFQLNSRPPKKGRNPKTGAAVHVPAKHVPHFKPGKEMRERVNLND